MARKMMTKEVTKTDVKLAVMKVVEGVPKAETLPDETLMGNITMESAQRQLSKKHGQAVTVFEVKPNTTTYEMPVDEFIKHATVKEPVQESEQTEATL